jgi:hypothetical protein
MLIPGAIDGDINMLDIWGVSGDIDGFIDVDIICWM